MGACLCVGALWACSTIGGPCHKWNPFMINEVAMEMTSPPPSSLLLLGGGRGYFRGKTYHSLPPPPPSLFSFSGPLKSCSDNQPNSQIGLFCSEHLWGWRGRGAGMSRKAFSARDRFSVFVCESNVWVCSSAGFYGKVSFPPLCSQRLPDTLRACKLLCSCMCVSVELCRAAGFTEKYRKKLSSDCVWSV